MGRTCGRRTVRVQVCYGMHAMMVQFFVQSFDSRPVCFC
jgi:hypothetical protein